MTNSPDPTLARLNALLNELAGAAMLVGVDPADKDAIAEVARLKREIREMFEQARRDK